GWHARDPPRQGHPLGWRQRRRRHAADHRRWSRDQHARAADRRQVRRQAQCAIRHLQDARSVRWRDPSNASPTNQSILVGDPSKTGIYVNINRFKPGNFSRPHFHPNDRYIMVLKGTWWVGTDTKFDQNATVPMPAGTFVTHFGKQVHFDGAKDEEVEVLTMGEGPATSTPAEQK